MFDHREEYEHLLTLVVPVRDAANRAGYSPRHVRQLCDMGRIAAVKRGKIWWVCLPSLLEYSKKYSR